MLPSDFMQQGTRPRSEILNQGNLAPSDSDKLNNWREDLQHYERHLEDMMSVNLDQNFKEELQHVDQWFRFLSETERTATVYTLLQHSSPVQIRFFISELQQLIKRDPLHSFLTPNNPDQDMQSQLAGAVAKMELEANQRLLGQTARRPPSAGSDVTRRRGTPGGLERHSFALGDEEYNRLLGPIGTSNVGNSSSSSNHVHFNNTIMDDFGRVPISRTSATRSSTHGLFSARARPRSVIEGDTSLMFPSGSASTWFNPPTSQQQQQQQPQPQKRSSTLLGRMGPTAERPKSADVSMWALPSLDPNDDKTTGNGNNNTSGGGNGNNSNTNGYRNSGWGVPSTVQFSDLSMRHLDSDLKRLRGGRHIPGTVPETDERNGSQDTTPSAALDSANLVLSMYGNSNNNNNNNNGNPQRRSHSPVPSVSASAPFSRRHLAPPGMEKHYGQFLNPADALGYDDHDYLSDHSDASNVSDRNRQRRPGKSQTPTGANRNPKDKKNNETVNMELLEDVPGWFRSLRLHKYNAIFEPMKWQDIIKLTDEDLEAKGVAALGARRKMLKVFETVKNHCDANNIKY
ncbi:rna-binding protein involved in translationalpartial [Lichtheimia corymbifera JMRC:FSU:9682]|uniref:Rna-binding protein involved in translationalpartial n=1 Tax=Lichtheimia corymbifera JMRC:FSU:9682 TaxID=1263082 RepID=A0A068RZ98_9FUNG|nr:rna-binding protein involved in translationalpartial [Lichtheimia corymbifera JMRC:FSU:9682]